MKSGRKNIKVYDLLLINENDNKLFIYKMIFFIYLFVYKNIINKLYF